MLTNSGIHAFYFVIPNKDGEQVVCLELWYATILSIFLTRENLLTEENFDWILCVCAQLPCYV